MSCNLPVNVSHPVANLVAHAIELDPPPVSLVLVLDTFAMICIGLLVVQVNLRAEPVHPLAILEHVSDSS